MFKARRRPAAVAAAVAALALAGAGYAVSSTGTLPSNTTDGFAETSAATPLGMSGGTHVTVASLALPAGAWVLSSEASIVNFGPSDYTRCRIVASGVQIASGTTLVGDPSQPGANGAGALVAARGLVGSVVHSTPFTAALDCSHDSSNSNPYVDPGAVLWAHAAPVLSSITH
jgi:hypothetical protein